jgi:hypothetical protein
MTGQPSTFAETRPSPSPMARWRCWLFNWIARWEEASLARSLGLPVERVHLIDLSPDD